ncbi:MAG TPA: monovalent cation/H(+) antiporter subunit G [Phycisphaerae bacterium]|nr:monovalent cation/H(+) antiporter subunit G [Phycisphaerae bacterium]
MPEIATWLMGIGLAFDLFGCIGLIRLPDVYNRAQAATKCVTLGTCMILIGVAVRAFAGTGPAIWPMGIKAILCAAFILLTSPVAAHAICRGAYLSGVRLWEGSVEDAFADRAREIRDAQAQAQAQAHQRSAEREEAETT